LVAPDGEVTAQVSETVPVNEFAGVTVMVEDTLDAKATVTLVGLLVSVKLLLFGACQKSPQPTDRGAAISNNLAHFPILIAAPSLPLVHCSPVCPTDRTCHCACTGSSRLKGIAFSRGLSRRAVAHSCAAHRLCIG
jgi:hypothetical protein